MFYKYTWDPKLIIGQIISIQCLYYVCLAGSLYVLDSLFLHTLSLEQMFSFRSVNVDNGWVVIFAFLINSLIGSVSLRFIVERSKKCLDHAATVTFIHFVISWSFSDSFPSSASWWIVQLVSMVIMAVVGEYLCMRKELMDIPLSRATTNSLMDSTPILVNPPSNFTSPNMSALHQMQKQKQQQQQQQHQMVSNTSLGDLQSVGDTSMHYSPLNQSQDDMV